VISIQLHFISFIWTNISWGGRGTVSKHTFS